MGVNNAPVTSFSKDGRHELKFFKSSHRYYLDKKPVKSNTGVGEGYPKGDVLGGWKTGQGSIYAIRMANKYKRTTGKFLLRSQIMEKRLLKIRSLPIRKKLKKLLLLELQSMIMLMHYKVDNLNYLLKQLNQLIITKEKMELYGLGGQ